MAQSGVRDDVAATVFVAQSRGGFVADACHRKHGGAGLAGIDLGSAVTKLSADLLMAEAGSFTRTRPSHDLVEHTSATAEFLSRLLPTALQSAWSRSKFGS